MKDKKHKKGKDHKKDKKDHKKHNKHEKKDGLKKTVPAGEKHKKKKKKWGEKNGKRKHLLIEHIWGRNVAIQSLAKKDVYTLESAAEKGTEFLLQRRGIGPGTVLKLQNACSSLGIPWNKSDYEIANESMAGRLKPLKLLPKPAHLATLDPAQVQS